MNIHSFFILKKSGACIYNKNFTNEIDYNVNLITPFFSAIFSFSEKIISRDLEVLEMGGLRFVFEIKDDFIFVLLSDSTASILFVNTRLDKIADIFFKKFPDTEKIQDYQEIEDKEFDQMVDSIIEGEEEIFKERALYDKMINLFKDLIFQNEIIGAAVLATNGNIIYSSLPNEILLRSLKELEIRFMTGAVELPELFYSLDDGRKVFSKYVKIPWKIDNFLIVLLFDKNVPLGMAEINLHKVSKQTINLI
ncbi:MAG: hypothetical protein BAJALOKI3v1_170002 [Promethearchaeota archaeon]|jgi:hypothetical protein|nr:MAG: hypothetical protein BAJALOKI3v1_170002 [Candidatus Lokiarchaeota archaeon]